MDSEGLIETTDGCQGSLLLGQACRSVGSTNTPADAGFELNFISDYNIGDGRFANNAWLQEMPEPITKITWDNAPSVGKRQPVDGNLHGYG